MSYNACDAEKKPLVVLTGPTAAGKSSLSVRLAKRIGGEIVSADSMQIYRKMDIGTAKITSGEMEGVPHYLLNELDPGEPFHVAEFQKRARAAVDQIHEKGHIPVITGGTGFYIQALLYDIDFSDHDEKEEYRQRLSRLLVEKGKDYLYEKLKKVDPEYALTVHSNNTRRVIRALEYFHETGEKLSDHNKTQMKRESPYHFAYFVLTMDREELYERINRRVDRMMDAGLLEEVRGLWEAGYSRDLVSMQGIGYKEFFDYFEGEATLNDVTERIKRDTRHFAKRQMTWFRREKEVIWLDRQQLSSDEETLLAMLRILKERKIIS